MGWNHQLEDKRKAWTNKSLEDFVKAHVFVLEGLVLENF